MEISGTVLRQVTYVSGAGTHTHTHAHAPSHGVASRARVRMGTGYGFCDEGHLQYYQSNTAKVLAPKKKLKLLKGFTKSGLASDPAKLSIFYHLQQNLASDAGEALLRELEAARAKEKEMKKKRKQEKKAKLKATKMNCESSTSSSSESSDSDCDCNQVVDMNSIRAGVGVVAPAPLDDSPLPKTPIVEDANTHRDAMELCSKNDICVSCVNNGFKNESAVVTTAPQKRIEVCMGNKCKRSGAAALLQEFERVVGAEGGAVVACKCMGKCKTAPNVKVQNSVDHSLAQGLDDSVKIPANPLCVGVGLEDVDAIVARFLGENHTDIGMPGAATAT
ncbi:hypothetical protein VNO78_22896 [Psophocarpus tetragonolobus]|uniref:Diacylglycerol O-acyltransferase 3, cytosolic n=1 Tax=Psophocarpus tetragonolobus TaxID=3891 RepID=A0AAN9S3X4_PSOTE